MDWLDVVRQSSLQQRAVEHQPETPRYSRARTKLRYVAERAVYLGERGNPLHVDSVEIAVWAPPGYGRGPGFFCFFLIYLKEDDPIFSVLFCSYDGIEGSPGFKSLDSARAFAAENGFKEGVTDEDPH